MSHSRLPESKFYIPRKYIPWNLIKINGRTVERFPGKSAGMIPVFLNLDELKLFFGEDCLYDEIIVDMSALN